MKAKIFRRVLCVHARNALGCLAGVGAIAGFAYVGVLLLAVVVKLVHVWFHKSWEETTGAVLAIVVIVGLSWLDMREDVRSYFAGVRRQAEEAVEAEEQTGGDRETLLRGSKGR